jgi:hypothetical protein
MIATTLNRIREHRTGGELCSKLLAGLGKTDADDEPLSFAKILEIIGLDDAILHCRAEPQHDRKWRLLAVKYARRVEHLNSDPAIKNAIDVAERYANGKANDEQLAAATSAAEDVAEGAEEDAAFSAGWAAAYAARDVGWFAAYCTAWAAEYAVRAAAGCAARDAERDWQAQEFLRVVTETEARAA